MTQSYVSHLYDVSRWPVPLSHCTSVTWENQSVHDRAHPVDVYVIVLDGRARFWLGRFPQTVAAELLKEVDQLINTAKALRGS